MATTNITSSAQLTSWLSSAQAGDIADCGTTEMPAKTFTQDYDDYRIIRGGVWSSGLEVSGASYLRFEELTVTANLTGGTFSPFRVSNGSHHIEIMDCVIDSGAGGYTLRVDFGVSDVLIEGNTIRGGSIDLFCSAQNVVVRGNSFPMAVEDVMRFEFADQLLIENNRADGLQLHRDGEAHSDFIQFSKGGTDITVRNNIVTPAGGDPLSSPWYQGLFFRTSTGGWNNIVVENNMLMCGNSNAIYAEPAAIGNSVARYNTCLSTSGTDIAANIIGFVSENNIKTSNIAGSGISGTTHTIQQDSSGSPFYYDEYYTNATVGEGVTLEDLRPVANSPAESIGAYALMATLLDGAPPPDPEPEPDPVVIVSRKRPRGWPRKRSTAV